MKFSLAASALIALLFALFGWQKETRLASLRETSAKLTAEATRLGLSTDTSPSSTTSSRSRRDRPDPAASVKTLTADLVTFANEVEQIEKSGRDTSEIENFQQRVADLIDRLASLDSTRLKLVIDELRASTSLSDENRRNLVGFAIFTLSSSQPRAAIELLTATSDLLPDRNMSKNVLSSALTRWATDDPAAAIDWLKTHGSKHPDLINEQTKRSLISGIAATDPALAFTLLNEPDPPANSYSSIIDAARTPAERTATLAALRDHLATVTDEKKRAEITSESFTSLARKIAAEGFESSSSWIASSNLTPAETEALANGLNHTVKPAETGRWLDWIQQSLPAEKSTAKIQSVFATWTANDYQSAGQWLNATPEGPAKTAAARSYAETVAPYDPATAVQWAETLPAGKDRDTTLKTIHSRWPEDDPAGAAAFAAKYGIR